MCLVSTVALLLVASLAFAVGARAHLRRGRVGTLVIVVTAPNVGLDGVGGVGEVILRGRDGVCLRLGLEIDRGGVLMLDSVLRFGFRDSVPLARGREECEG